MTYNVFGGTLSLTQSINPQTKIHVKSRLSAVKYIHYAFARM